ncbi:MAG TPA: DUF1524 domain-containing protein [Phycicoccus sp.]|nr:DUF1524 domain-containing protein [Phycicoccus sp.]
MNAPAGWYPTDRGLRYWDGTRWTEHFAPASPPTPAPAPGVRASRGVPTTAAWLGWGGLVLAAVTGGASSGLGGFLAAVGTYVLVVAVVAVVRGHVDWARLRSRTAGVVALGAAIVIGGIGGATADQPATTPPTAAATRTSSPGPSSPAPSPATTTPTPSPSVTPTPSTTSSTPTVAPPARGTALAALAALPVKGRAPKTGYSRDQFGQAWADVDRNGCDTRNDVLRRDLTDVTLKAGTRGCLVLAGTLHDPYTGRTIAFVRGESTSAAVQVDHVVSLSDAWQKGAQQQSRSTRTAFANDPLNLLAVDGPTNSAKGDGDAATWLPPRKSFRCAFVARQVAVKAKYHLWVTAAERDAITRILDTCPTQALPRSTAIPLGGGTVRTVTPTPAPAPPPPTAPSAGLDPRFGTCKEAKAAGYGPYVSGRDPEYSWYRDADHDGTVCE